jgi:hypothetical protein
MIVNLKRKKTRKGKLMFYVNGKLKHIDDFDEIIARRLNDNNLKQVRVPFNFTFRWWFSGVIREPDV